MYLNSIRAVSALALAITATIGIQNIHTQSEVNPAILTAEIIQVEPKIATLSGVATGAAIIAPQLQEIDAPSAEIIEYTREQKVEILQKYLVKHNSPMTDNAQDFIDAAEQYNLDWRLVPAIAGVESTFGKNVLKDSYNPFGWAGGYYMFESWRDAIYKVAEGLSENYVKDGIDTPEKMQPRYAPPSTTWGSKVRFFMNKIQGEAESMYNNGEELSDAQ